MKPITLIIILLLLSSLASSASKNVTISKEAQELEKQLRQAEKDMQEMQELGLGITRYNDTLFFAQQVYNAKLEAEKNGEKADYSSINEKIMELKEIGQKAFSNLDELKALELTINKTEGIDLKPVFELYGQAKNEFASERYEKSQEYIDLAYKKISELEALQSKVKAFYEATSRSLLSFLKQNWKKIAAIISVIAVILFLTHRQISRELLKLKIRNLEKRKISLRDLIKETQIGYFDKKTMGESDYHIRIKKYGELMRDINRQIPLLKERLALVSKKKPLNNFVIKQ